MEPLGSVGAPIVRGGVVGPSLPFAHEADHVAYLVRVPHGGVPVGHPDSLPVQETHQVSLGGTPAGYVEQNLALKAVKPFATVARHFRA